MSRPSTRNGGEDFTLFDVEEQVLRDTDDMLRKLEEVGRGVRSLATAYRRGYREQQRLVRISDRMQLELQDVNRNLARQTEDLRRLNAALQAEVEKRERLEKELRRYATIDELTGLFVRRHFMDLAERELARARRTETPVSVLMLDLDHFKLVNDTHGHATGDVVLTGFATLLIRSLRESDIAGRLGGEEFAVLLPEADLATAVDVGQRLHDALAETAFEGQDGQMVHCTTSIGAVRQIAGEPLDKLLNRADRALYEAKGAGRNRTMVALDGETFQAADLWQSGSSGSGARPACRGTARGRDSATESA